jgi:hypothetical protein
MSSKPAFWMDGEGTDWVEAPDATAREALDLALAAGIDDYADESFVVIGQETTTLRDCPLDDCEGHPAPDPDKPGATIYLDCPEYRRTVWRIEGMESDGLAFDPIEKAIAEGRAVHVNDNLVVRSGEVHWADDCWCPRCDAAGRAIEDNRPNEADSLPLFALSGESGEPKETER